MYIHFKNVAVASLAFLSPVFAHTRFTNFFVDGTNQGEGVCVRMSMDFHHTMDPVKPITSPDMACGAGGEKGVARVCPVNAGSTLTFNFRIWADGTHPESIDPSHKGPCSVFMKKVDSAIADNNAAGDGWFKIWDEGYDEAAGKWCTTKLIENNGHLSVIIPPDLQGGYYLVRPELLALHNAEWTPPDPQFFIGCAQIFLDSTGSGQPATISIPDGYVNMDTPGMSYNIYADKLSLPYPMIGPSAYKGSNTTGASSTNATQTEGLKPSGCIMENANWCGFELPSYSDENGCWAASKNCYNQSEACWAAAPPTGGANCLLWGDKCHNVDDNCHAGNFQGPPDAGKVLTPTPAPLVGSTAEFSRLIRRWRENGWRREFRHGRSG